MGWMLDAVGRAVARYLDQPEPGYEPFTPADFTALVATIQTGDVLLQQPNFWRDQVFDAINLVACRSLCRADGTQRLPRYRAP